MEKFEIFGRTYRLQSGLSSDEVSQVNKEIVKRVKTLSAEYPTLDKIDILVLYVVELNEKIIELEKKLKKEKDKIENIKIKLSHLEEKIRGRVKKS